MRTPRFFLLVAVFLTAAGAAVPARASEPRATRAAGTPVPAVVTEESAPAVAIAAGALSLISPGGAMASAFAALDAALASGEILEEARGISLVAADGISCPVPDRTEVVDNFGQWRGSHRHAGVDIRANHGLDVRAVLPGTVTMAEWDGAYGLTVHVVDRAGDLWVYAHLSAHRVTVGAEVLAGRHIGNVGCTGRCTGSHLHLERRPGGGAPVDTYDALVRACSRPHSA